MRPLRVELEGIGSFRTRTELDLTGVDLFALSGPTGAGKTTLMVDAMMLALYGTVPRYEDRRMVAPVISQGANEGRVRLTFSVERRTYTATRVVRRTKQGATTKEARLEEVTGGGSVVLAGSADEVTETVGRLLGLSFDQFCRSVLLPQGAFDRFLFAKPADRGDLLLQLLDLRLHEAVGRRARAEATAAAARADAAQRRLDGDLAGADPAELDRLTARIGQLDVLADRCRQVQDELDELKARGGQLAAAADAAAGDRDALAALTRPPDVDALAEATRAAEGALAAAAARRTTAAETLDAAEDARTQLPPAEVLATLERTERDRAEADAALPDLQAAAEAAASAVVVATRAFSDAETAVADAERAADEARRSELVHALTDGLHAGDDCPVCGTALQVDPPAAPAAATTAADAAVRSARADRDAAATALRDAERAEGVARDRVEQAERRRDHAVEARRVALADAGVDETRVPALVAQVRAADEAVATARAEDRAARADEAEARRAVEAARDGERAAWATLDRARDSVSRLAPPSPDRTDLAGAWDHLLTWAEQARPAAERAADEAAGAVRDARERYAAISTALRQECHDAGVEVAAGTAAGEAVAHALATARARHATVTDRLAQVEAVTAERDAAREQAQVADHLGKLLRADGFERWLLARALTRLVVGASTILRELSSGAYSLDLDATNQFLVVDHRNADEPRTVRSLSGGERFLASLALALALADHVAELAADGAAKLESLFLDEGFGTLDPDTLDVVAAALEELGARGRVVGIVTHVRDLAERLPVRFEVRKGPDGSRVTRVDDGAALPVDTPAEDVA